MNRRDRYFDALRVLAIVRVSVYHFFPLAALELAFPSMGVMFGLAGSLMANSLGRSPAPKVLFGRMRRLLPVLWVLSAVVAPAMLLVGWDERPAWWRLVTWIVPFADPPSSTWGLQAAEVLWYLVTYLWLVALSPVLLWLYRRARLVTILLPIAAMAVLTACAGGHDLPLEQRGDRLVLPGRGRASGVAAREVLRDRVRGGRAGVAGERGSGLRVGGGPCRQAPAAFPAVAGGISPR